MFVILTIWAANVDKIDVDTADSIGEAMAKVKEITEAHGFCSEKDEIRLYDESGGRLFDWRELDFSLDIEGLSSEDKGQKP